MSHEISLAVWDVSSPVVVGRRPTLKIGVSCTSGCNLSGTLVDVFNDAGERIGTGTLGSDAWPATAALYWAELDLVAPECEGELSLDINATPTSPHEDATSIVTFVVSRPPEYRVTFEVSEQGSGIPLADVELRIGAFRTTTNDSGRAHVDVPGGTYDVHAWKLGYDLMSRAASVTADTTLRLEVAVTLSPEQPYWM